MKRSPGERCAEGLNVYRDNTVMVTVAVPARGTGAGLPTGDAPTVAEIAEVVGVSRATVYRHLWPPC